MSPVQVKVDTKTSTVGRIVTLVASVAGVSDAVVVVEGAPAGACAIAAAPDAGDLEGVATCARYLASLATAEGEAARLGGVESPEADAEVSEWLTRAVTEYGVAGDPIAYLQWLDRFQVTLDYFTPPSPPPIHTSIHTAITTASR